MHKVWGGVGQGRGGDLRAHCLDFFSRNISRGPTSLEYVQNEVRKQEKTILLQAYELGQRNEGSYAIPRHAQEFSKVLLLSPNARNKRLH